MCGIAGIITREQSVADQAVERMNAAQQHRGPDGSGKKLLSFGTHWLGLGHRRFPFLTYHLPVVNRWHVSHILIHG